MSQEGTWPALALTGLEGEDLVVEGGELLALIGPSGSGKTTLLRGICGLGPMPRGRVLVGGADMSEVPVERRPVTMMFETPVLLDQLTVAQNVAFAVDRSRDDTTPQDAVDAAVTSLNLWSLADRHPQELSAGQRQRVALARALVRRPEVMLFDEPLAHVDPAARVGLRREILRSHRRMGGVSLYFTHDWQDALAVADRIAVLRSGRIVQVAAPQELYRRPLDAWVATQVGVPNQLPATVLGIGRSSGQHRVTVSVLGREVAVPASPSLTERGQGCIVLGHPHAVRVREVEETGRVDPRIGRILSSAFGGDHVDDDVETDAGTLVARRPLRADDPLLSPGTVVEVELDPAEAWAVPG